MKRCPRCGICKEDEEFSLRRRNGREYRQPWCRLCKRAYEREHPRILLTKRLIRQAKAKPCADCGVMYPYYVMDFDHRPGSDKTSNLTKLAQRGASREVLLAEIAKCDVVYANCHRERTYRRKQWGEVYTLL
jgi:hypothetical protein